MSRLRRLFLCDCHFFNTCNLARRRWGLDEQSFELLVHATSSARQEHGFVLLPPGCSYPIIGMLSSIHAIRLTISETRRIIKVKSSLQINYHGEESGSLWQTHFFDHALRTVGDYHQCIDYIHMNPVRRGLVQSPERWLWSSIHDYNGSRSSVLPSIESICPSTAGKAHAAALAAQTRTLGLRQ